MKSIFKVINFQNYLMIAFTTGIISFFWLLLLPGDPKNAWILGLSKIRMAMLGGIIIVVFAFGFIWVKMILDQGWSQEISQRVEKILVRDLIWFIVLPLSSLGLVVGICFLSMAFGLTDIFLQSFFLRLAPWAFFVTVMSALNMLCFWCGDFDKENNSLYKQDIRMWVTRYDLTPRNLLFVYLFPTLYVVLYFALWKLQSDHSLALLFMGENHPIELVTFLALFIGGIQGFKLAWLARDRKELIWVWVFFAVFSFGILFVAMEEIAWGQQFFDLKTPTGLKEINLQNEITVHNIQGVPGNFGGSIKLFGWVGLLGILLSYNKKFQIIGVSPVLILWFLVILVFSYLSRIITSLIPVGNDYVLLDVISETTEMFVGLASFLYVWFQTRMLSYGKLRKAFAKKVFLDHDHLTVMITDGRSLSVPLIWIPRLHKATEAERNNLRLLEGGVILHWPDLETKIRVEQLISGVVSIENRPLLNQWGKDGHH